MIKTIVNTDVSLLDKAVNSFMTEKKANLPVRTESYVVPGEGGVVVYHKATVFYNEGFPSGYETGTPIPTENVGVPSEITSKPEKVGALWYQKDGKLTGQWKDKTKIEIDEKNAATLVSQEKLETTMKGIPVKIMKNKFKNTANHPDYIIYTRGG